MPIVTETRRPRLRLGLRIPFRRQWARVVRDFSGASGQAFRAYLLGALDATLDGASLVGRLVIGEVDAAQANDLMRTIEHRGDAERAKLVAELRSALVTPIDREDLFRLSRAIDDILDNLRDFVRQWALFEQKRSEIIAPVAELVATGIVDLRAAVEALIADPHSITERALAAKKTINTIRRVFDQQVATLLVGEVTSGMLRERELLRRLDVVGLRLGEAVDALSDAAVKRAET
jgi:plasmid stabilization system protein ParE